MKTTTLKIDDIKQNVMSLKGKTVQMAVNKGRKHFVKFEAEVVATYPNIFTIEASDDMPIKTMSYAYTEILCGNVRIQPKWYQIDIKIIILFVFVIVIDFYN